MADKNELGKQSISLIIRYNQGVNRLDGIERVGRGSSRAIAKFLGYLQVEGFERHERNAIGEFDYRRRIVKITGISASTRLTIFFLPRSWKSFEGIHVFSSFKGRFNWSARRSSGVRVETLYNSINVAG